MDKYIQKCHSSSMSCTFQSTLPKSIQGAMPICMVLLKNIIHSYLRVFPEKYIPHTVCDLSRFCGECDGFFFLAFCFYIYEHLHLASRAQHQLLCDCSCLWSILLVHNFWWMLKMCAHFPFCFDCTPLQYHNTSFSCRHCGIRREHNTTKTEEKWEQVIKII